MVELLWTAPDSYAADDAGEAMRDAVVAFVAAHGIDPTTIARGCGRSARIWRDGDRTELHVSQYVLDAGGRRYADPTRPDVALTRTRIVPLVSDPPQLAGDA